MIKILGPNDPALGALNQIIEQHPELEIQLSIIPWENYRAKLDKTLQNYDFDAVFIPGHIWMPQLVEDDLIQPLDQFFSTSSKQLITDYDADGIFERIQNECRYTKKGGESKQYVLPLFTDGHIVFYRSDLVKLPDEISPKDLLGLMNAFSLPKGMKPFAQKAHSSEILLDFLPYFWEFGGCLFEDGKILFNSIEGVQALNFYCSLKTFSPENVESYGNAEIVKAITTGEVAMVISWGGQAASIFNELDSGPNAEIGTASLRNAWNATWGVSIPTNVPELSAQRTFATLLKLLGNECDELVTKIAGSPVRKRSYSKEAKAKFPWLKSQESLLMNCRILPVDPTFSKYLSPLYSSLHDAYTGKKDISEALDEVAKNN